MARQSIVHVLLRQNAGQLAEISGRQDAGMMTKKGHATRATTKKGFRISSQDILLGSRLRKSTEGLQQELRFHLVAQPWFQQWLPGSEAGSGKVH
jgi:hypothetical protein